MLLVIASTDMAKRLATEDFSLDLEMGIGTDNDFELTTPERVYGLETIFFPGTEYGGIVDDDEPSMGDDGESVTYHGSTWTGVLDQNVTRPPSGQSHLTVSGSPRECIAALLQSCGVGGPFTAADGEAGSVSYTIPRFATLYEAIVGALSSAGFALGMECADGEVRLFAKAPATVDETRGVGFDAKRGYRPVNHLVVLGKGELRDREVIDLYADEDGVVSTSQSIFGLAHRAEVYELSSKEGEELESDGIKKLEEYQEQRDSVKIVVPEGVSVSIGDRLSATSPRYGIRAGATVTGIVVEASSGVVTVTPKTDGKMDSAGYD